MVSLKVFLYVSTTYSNADKKEVSEELYEAPADWRQFIQIAEQMDNEDLQKVTVKCRGNLPNTYTFTKSMAEQAVNDICVGKFATIILRPSIGKKQSKFRFVIVLNFPSVQHGDGTC